MKEELQLLLATRGRGAIDDNDIPSTAREHEVYVTKKHTEKTLEWYLEGAYLQNSSSCEKIHSPAGIIIQCFFTFLIKSLVVKEISQECCSFQIYIK